MNRSNGKAPRLFADRELSGTKIELDTERAHYMSHVLRLRRDDAVVLFNGRGQELLATIASTSKRGCTLESIERLEPRPESSLELVLMQSLVKADAMDLIVQKATELGVRVLRPIVTRYSVVRLDAERAERRLAHWRRISQSACEQSGRHVPMQIEAPTMLQACCESLPPTGERLLLSPEAEEPFPQQLPTSTVAILIGPEGGFDAEDLRLVAGAGFRDVRLGVRILRAETAALAACALAQAYWGDLR